MGSGTGASSMQPQPKPSRLEFVPAFDGLRAVAVLLVIYHHVSAYFPSQTLGAMSITGGFLGVDVFFVLSGFLITALLLTEQGRSGRVAFGAFYIRRARRLFPALWVLLAVHTIYTWTVGLPLGPQWVAVRNAMLYVSNWDFAQTAPPVVGLGHLWSLAIEEQYYLVWPLVVVVLLGICRNDRWALGATVGSILAVALWRAHLWNELDGFERLSLYQRTDTRADSLLVGALVAQVWARGRLPRRGYALPAAVAMAGITVAVLRLQWTDQVLYLGGFTVFAVAVAVVVAAVVVEQLPGQRFLATRPLRAIGLVSYGLYLWHAPIFEGVARHGGRWPFLVRVTVGLALTAVVTAASWFLVERPFLRGRVRGSPREVPIEPAVAGS